MVRVSRDDPGKSTNAGGTHLRKRHTYANVAATLALVFSMSGGALAASHYLIRSTKQISPKVLKELKGRTGNTGATGKEGPAGKTGPEGKVGPEGPAGPSEAFGSTAKTEGVAGIAADIIRKVTVPAGDYTVSATVTMHNEGSSATNPNCVLMHPSETFFGEAETTVAAKSWGDLALSGVVTTTGSTEIWLTCKAETSTGEWEAPTLTVTKVGSLG